MTATAVVTGSPARVDDVAQAIARRGVTALRIDRGDEPARAGAAVAEASVDHCVQLPGDVPSPSSTKTSALAALFGRGLMGRFGEVDVLLPKLAPGCAVVLVAGETVDDLSSLISACSDVPARDAGRRNRDRLVAVGRAGHRRAPPPVSGPDRRYRAGLRPQWAELVERAPDVEPDMSCDDWRLACLSATGPEA